jgi:hypothetical protein
MEYYPIYEETILGEGPLFRDEIGWTQSIDQQSVDRYDLSRRGIRFRGSSGLHIIYFPLETLEAALIRFSHRYRGVIEVIIRRGLSGERMLLQQGWYEDEVDYIRDCIPDPKTEYNPAVYELLWKSLTYEEYLGIIEVLDRHHEAFIPADLAEAAGLDHDGSGFFSTFIRSNLIGKVDRETTTRARGRNKSTSIDTVPDEEYLLTDQGKKVIEGALSEHDRLFESESYAPLDADIEAARAHIPPRDEVREPSEKEITADLDVPEADEFSQLADELESSLRDD